MNKRLVLLFVLLGFFGCKAAEGSSAICIPEGGMITVEGIKETQAGFFAATTGAGVLLYKKKERRASYCGTTDSLGAKKSKNKKGQAVDEAVKIGNYVFVPESPKGPYFVVGTQLPEVATKALGIGEE